MGTLLYVTYTNAIVDDNTFMSYQFYNIVRPGLKVTMHRPGGGTGTTIIYGEDPYDNTSPRQTFAHWDSYFISWLEKNEYQADYCTDFDIHKDPHLLDSYRLLISAGHDEYWSNEMRKHIDRFTKNGGNLTFFSRNISF